MKAIAHAEPCGSPELAPNFLQWLKHASIWLLWKSEPQANPTKKPRKVPYYASGRLRSGEWDSTEDRAQLVTYPIAAAAYDSTAPGTYAGLGLALGPDGRGGCVQGIDLDDVATAGTGDIADLWTRGPCAGLGYVEASPSGTGIHILGYGRHFQTLGSKDRVGIEAYSGGRFFTFTGRFIVDSLCSPYDLADYVEQELAPRHGAGARTSTVNNVEVVPVDPKTVTELRSALAHMRSDDRTLWVDIGLALKGLGDTGRGLWVEWSQASESYEPRDAARTWNSFAPQRTNYKAVFAKAQKMGWLNPRHAERAKHGAETGERFLRNMSPTGTSEGSVKGGSGAEARRLLSRSLGGVSARAIEWLWTGWIPKGYITIFAGESGAGKSTVLTDIVARVTTGRAWPGESDASVRAPGRVLWLGSEDGIEEMTVPRLLACGANRNNVIELQGATYQGKRSTFSMQDDLEGIENCLIEARDSGFPFAMLVIDPVTSYLPGQRLRKVDLNDAGQLRSILEPWLPLAQRHGIAVVCVTHFAKATDRSMMNRVLGSAAFAQTCRSLCAVIEREATDDYEPEPHEKALLQVKMNLPEHPGGSWKFVTEKVEVEVDARNGKPIYATRPNWLELDGTLTPKSAVGPARGPKSQIGPAFSLWLHSEFGKMKAGEWAQASIVKAAAVRDVRVSESWWNKYSSDYLDRKNLNGTWMCRPIAARLATPEGG